MTRDKADHYTLQAKKEGYPARSVYKLKEINEKFRLLRPEMKVLDIGAAPGSWSLFVLRTLKNRCEVTAFDLQPLGITPPAGLVFLTVDAFGEKAATLISERGPFDLVMSDAAPATTGNRTVDTGRSFTIAESVLALVETHLSPGGSVVIKIFQGGDEKVLLERMKGLFGSARAFKPKACRSDSFETYLIGTDKKGV
ncbi:MAG: RlmE family RNA methyltransferase [Spirochaetales bacterium]|nr:RlmE family RNA methyltransferase [Spirochaetales bacterium]